MFNSILKLFLLFYNCSTLRINYSVTVEECLNALFRAKWYGFFNLADFDLYEYEKYEVNYT